jgi:hypothetical protein
MLVSPGSDATKLRAMPCTLFHLIIAPWYLCFAPNAQKNLISSPQAFDDAREPEKKKKNCQKKKKR